MILYLKEGVSCWDAIRRKRERLAKLMRLAESLVEGLIDNRWWWDEVYKQMVGRKG